MHGTYKAHSTLSCPWTAGEVEVQLSQAPVMIGTLLISRKRLCISLPRASLSPCGSCARARRGRLVVPEEFWYCLERAIFLLARFKCIYSVVQNLFVVYSEVSGFEKLEHSRSFVVACNPFEITRLSMSLNLLKLSADRYAVN